MNEMIAAGVVLYNPEDIERLNRCLDGILEEFDAVYILTIVQIQQQMRLPKIKSEVSN